MNAQFVSRKNSNSILMADAQHIGYGQQRPTLEDRCTARSVTTASGLELSVGIVADGIGGSSAGEAASQITVDTILNTLQNSTETDPLKLAEQALQAAHQAVRENGRLNPRLRSMGTTATLALIHNNTLYLGHVGDSRAYLLRKGKLTQLTLDHTWGNENVRKGLLTLEEARRHARREELARYIGQANTPVLEIDVGYRQDGTADPAKSVLIREGIPLQEGDVVLLCTDGLIKERRNGGGNYVEESEIISTLARNEPKDAANTLLSYALGRQVDDNVSVVVMEVPGKKQVPITTLIQPKYVLLTGLLAFFAVIAGILFALIQPPPPTPTANKVSQPTMAVKAGIPFVRVLQSSGASILEGEQPQALFPGEEFGEAERTILETSLGGIAELQFADGSQVWLAENSKVHFVRDSQMGVVIEIERGQLLIRSNSLKVASQNRQYWGWTQEGATMGITYTPEEGRFLVDCVGGVGACYFQSPNQSLSIPAGQRVGIERGLNKSPEPAVYESWARLAPGAVALPTSTPTLTATATLEPTNTPVPRITTRPSSGGGGNDGGGGGGGSGDGDGGGSDGGDGGGSDGGDGGGNGGGIPEPTN